MQVPAEEKKIKYFSFAQRETSKDPLKLGNYYPFLKPTHVWPQINLSARPILDLGR